MKRAMARELCMKILYEMSMQKKYDRDILNYYLESESEQLDEQREYVTTAVTSFLEKIEEVDALIEQYAIGWHVDRLAKVDLAILRLAITEMQYIDDIPKNVSINEALELAKKYSTEESSPFINGILDKLIKKEV
ncbi:transcription antitermination factor NusB [Serpentinicella alkaliphila]|uniref:Transcription antitermination protein NusB n=1 Tax=Serpentinicella alkaliphila TaxID=1734049 RepID=A0A4R2TH51_9FIRM|nr:transcription antitermination factor NusB [Serpentinicella alkaliphila]TCQ02890.1 NusB antitermination factor [Serpentinicella alkaliphila]